MGNLLSSSTIYANAYLTSKGRDYLFNNENNRFVTIAGQPIDLLKITQFSLSDPDANYNVDEDHSLLEMGNGNIPDLSGENENCIKSAIIEIETNLISFDGSIPGGGINPGIGIEIQYMTNLSDDTVVININTGSNPLNQ